jgi:hypothetical protein
MKVTAEWKFGVGNPYQRLMNIIKFSMQYHVLESVTDRTDERPMKCFGPSVTYWYAWRGGVGEHEDPVVFM